MKRLLGVATSILLLTAACSHQLVGPGSRQPLPVRLSEAELRAALPLAACYRAHVAWAERADSSARPAIPSELTLTMRIDTVYAGALQYAEVLRTAPSRLPDWHSLSTWRVAGDTVFIGSATRASFVRASLTGTPAGLAGTIHYFLDLGMRGGDGVLRLLPATCASTPDA